VKRPDERALRRKRIYRQRIPAEQAGAPYFNAMAHYFLDPQSKIRLPANFYFPGD